MNILTNLCMYAYDTSQTHVPAGVCIMSLTAIHRLSHVKYLSVSPNVCPTNSDPIGTPIKCHIMTGFTISPRKLSIL